jgi:hypothetical protein
MTAAAVLWEVPCIPAETVRDAAERFVREVFGAERRIVWTDSPGEFRFADGHWCYLLTFEAGRWRVCRSPKLTPRGKARAKARREARG